MPAPSQGWSVYGEIARQEEYREESGVLRSCNTDFGTGMRDSARTAKVALILKRRTYFTETHIF